jgi:tRNA threonylcarbamoyladenosine biosynthesis protein TsaE
MPSAEVTRALGAELARALLAISDPPAIVIALNGELGAGKTTFVGGLLAEMGVASPIRSPTYTLIEPYTLRSRALYHLDLYRLADPSELETLALRDLLEPGAILLVEWAERAATLLQPDLTLRFAYWVDDTQSIRCESLRQIELCVHTTIGNELAAGLKIKGHQAGVSL